LTLRLVSSNDAPSRPCEVRDLLNSLLRTSLPPDPLAACLTITDVHGTTHTFFSLNAFDDAATLIRGINSAATCLATSITES
jgi:hypothetical protein